MKHAKKKYCAFTTVSLFIQPLHEVDLERHQNFFLDVHIRCRISIVHTGWPLSTHRWPTKFLLLCQLSPTHESLSFACSWDCPICLKCNIAFLTFSRAGLGSVVWALIMRTPNENQARGWSPSILLTNADKRHSMHAIWVCLAFFITAPTLIYIYWRRSPR